MPGSSPKQLTTAEIATAGFLSAIPTTLIAAPVERAKVILQIQGQGGGGSGEQKYRGVLDVVRGLYKEGGLRSIFRGSAATLARDGPGSAVCVHASFLSFSFSCRTDGSWAESLLFVLCRYFAAYEVTKKALTPAEHDPSQLNLGAIVFAGGMAGVAMWSISIPPDVRCAVFEGFGGGERHLLTE